LHAVLFIAHIYPMTPVFLCSNCLLFLKRLGLLSLFVCCASSVSPAQDTPVLSEPPSTPVENPPGTTSAGREATPVENLPQVATPQSETAPAATSSAPPVGWKAGVDLYYGVSNLRGNKRFRDGFWIGYGPAYPSVVYARYANEGGETAKLALGLGKLYGSAVPTVHQPVEAWYQKPVGKFNVTAGKFYVPFELQEWQYETKWGVMLQRSQGAYDFSGSLNYNFNLDEPNAYFRVARRFGSTATVGLSLGAGRGLSFDSVHNKALGLDATFSYKGFQLISSYMGLRSGSSADDFNFGFAKLSYTRLGRFTPFVSRHRWVDDSGDLDSFRSTTLGLTYQLTRRVALDTAYSAIPNKRVLWGQVHWVQEW
jgi:hypothetical protein